MWCLKVLTGPEAGKTFNLKMGTNIVGRAPHCDVVLVSQGISKEHTQIEVYNDKIIITDLKSRNGTFVNGVQIKSQKVTSEDKISLFDVFVSVVTVASQQRSPRPIRPKQPRGQANYVHPDVDGNLAYQQQMPPQGQVTVGPQTNFFAHLKQYLDEVVLPGVYKLAEWFEFRWVLGFFVAGFITFVTAMSTIPLLRILRESIERESQNRAITIARTLAQQNQPIIAQGLTSTTTVEFARREPGVKNAYILSGSGNHEVLAPAELSGQVLTKVPFVATATKTGKEGVEQVDSSTIVAVVPLYSYRSDIGQAVVTAHSVVVYEMDPIDGNKTFSLFIQVLFIALIVGGLLLFFLTKTIEQPLVELNQQIVQFLKNGSGQISTRFQIPILQQIISNMSSALSRSAGGFAGDQMQPAESDRTMEVINLLNLIGFPAIAIQASDRVVLAVNEHFNSGIGQGTQWPGLPISQILDLALKLNLQSLTDRAVQSPAQPATDHIDINSYSYDLTASAIMGSKDVAYVVVTFVQKGGS